MKTGYELTRDIMRRYQDQLTVMKELHVTEWLELQTDDPAIRRQLRVRHICELSDLTRNALLEIANIRSGVKSRHV